MDGILNHSHLGNGKCVHSHLQSFYKLFLSSLLSLTIVNNIQTLFQKGSSTNSEPNPELRNLS